MEPLHHNLADNMRGSGYSSKVNPLMRSAVLVVMALLLQPVYGWRSGSSYSIYGDSLNRDWIASSSVSLEVNGCVWAQVADTDDGECLEKSSEDGTVYWYKMANCRRPQVAFSLYADDGSNAANCNSKNFKETFVTTTGVEQFLNTLSTYAQRELAGEGEHKNEKRNNQYPLCEKGNNGYYYGLGCASDGSFVLLGYNDAYCLEPTGTVTDTLSSLNQWVGKYDSCTGIGSYAGKSGSSLAYDLVTYADSCSSLDNSICTDSGASTARRDTAARSSKFSSIESGQSASWETKLKYVFGGLFLLASFVMFTGILFTNRRRRRALLQRKFRQSKTRDDRTRSKSKSRSKSRTRDGEAGSTARKSSRSKTRSKSRTRDPHENGGVLA